MQPRLKPSHRQSLRSPSVLRLCARVAPGSSPTSSRRRRHRSGHPPLLARALPSLLARGRPRRCHDPDLRSPERHDPRWSRQTQDLPKSHDQTRGGRGAWKSPKSPVFRTSPKDQQLVHTVQQVIYKHQRNFNNNRVDYSGGLGPNKTQKGKRERWSTSAPQAKDWRHNLVAMAFFFTGVVSS